MLFKRDGVTPNIVVNNSRECREANCHIVNTEPRSPWMIAAEGLIKEPKCGSSRKLLSKCSPRLLWDHSIELEAMIRVYTALDCYALEG